MYERLIGLGIADADAGGGAIDHLTARRLAIWLAARPQSPVFSQSLVQFTQTGEISRALKTQLRIHARSGNYRDWPQAARLMRYSVARGRDTGPVGENFGSTCDEIDRADVILAGLRERVLHNQAQPETGSPEILALARRNPGSHEVNLILDPATANIALYAIAAHAEEREAHIREVERYAATLPERSWGRRNRDTIITRETRAATRLRAIEQAYRTAIDRDPTITSTDLTRAPHSLEFAADQEIELE